MADTPENPAAPEPAPEPAAAVPPPVVTKRKGRRKWLLLPLSIILLPVLIFALWAWVTLGYVYASGDRAGYVQKLSKKGWLCKTWEGELAMVNLPGSVTPQIFHFTVRKDSIARLLEKEMGKRVSLTYEEHRGVPTTCFGETGYFVTNVRVLGP
ncbi:MAG TPA: hypothetical protein VFS56_06360 [Gemmatimonadaceae bacterium]|nr:hypothetical protein [Gemmatimonadaceae bacterium]